MTYYPERSRALCSNCLFKGWCKSKEIVGCPCLNCLIKGMCVHICENAAEYFKQVYNSHRNRS